MKKRSQVLETVVHGVFLLLGLITDGSVQLIPADTVVAALGMRANDTGELEALVQRAGVPCHKIGDCVRARKIYDAVSEGYLTALSL